jgi:hypothetical protein
MSTTQLELLNCKMKVSAIMFIAASKNELRVRVLNVSASSPDVFGSHIGPHTDCRV